MNFHIYILREKGDDEARYVGCTINPKNRLYGHVLEAVNYPTASAEKTKWIRSISIVELEVIDLCSEDESREREKQWIDHFRNIGHRLTNKNPNLVICGEPEIKFMTPTTSVSYTMRIPEVKEKEKTTAPMIEPEEFLSDEHELRMQKLERLSAIILERLLSLENKVERAITKEPVP